MTPPRRPRGEKPATTIRFLRRQIANIMQELAAVRLACADKEKVIAGYDVQLSEVQDTAHRIAESAVARRVQHESAMASARVDAARLAYLEGYYAKSQETLPPEQRLADHQAETHPPRGAGNPQGVPHGERLRQTAGAERHPAAPRPTPRTGGPVRDQHLDNRPHPEGRTVEHVEISDDMDRPMRELLGHGYQGV